MLSTEEKERYTRHFLLDGWNEEVQEKIKNTTVFVAGARRNRFSYNYDACPDWCRVYQDL